MFYSQYGQDIYLAGFFGDRRNGTYIDIGAYDGLKNSNTAYFEKEKGWCGLCVEPNQDIYQQLRENRKAMCENKVVWNYTGEIDFLVDTTEDTMSGVYDFMRNESKKLFDDKKHESKQTKYPCIEINQLMQTYGFRDIDLLSVDIEGSEWVILLNIDYDYFNIKSICVENNNGWNTIYEHLTKQGYVLGAIMGQDSIYIKNLRSYAPHYIFQQVRLIGE